MRKFAKLISLTALLLLAMGAPLLAQEELPAAEEAEADSSGQDDQTVTAQPEEEDAATADPPAHDQPETEESAQTEQVTAEPEPSLTAERTAEDIMNDGREAVTQHSTQMPTIRTQTVPLQKLPYSNAFTFGAYLSYNARDGYRKYDGIDQYQHVPGNNFFSYGIALGRRVELRRPYLLQVTFEIGTGSVDDDEYEVDLKGGGSTMATQTAHYVTSGTRIDALMLFPARERTYFLSLGAGMHVTSYSESLSDSWSGQEYLTSDSYSTFSPSASIGAGMDIPGKWPVSVSYNLKILMSVNLTEVGELFPMGAEYREFLYSHSIQVQYLFVRKKR